MANPSTQEQEIAQSPQTSYHYSLIIRWDERDSIFVAMVPELPGCVTHGTTYEEAVQQAQDAIASVVETRMALGRPIPPPRTFKDVDLQM